jgi:hypothetical protein
MYDLIVACLLSAVVVAVGFVAAEVVGRLGGRDPRIGRLTRRAEDARLLLAKLEKRREQREKAAQKVRAAFDRARGEQSRLRRRIEDDGRSPDFAVRAIAGWGKADDEVYLVVVTNRRARVEGGAAEALLDESWAEAQTVLVRAATVEDARVAALTQYPASAGFQVTAVQRAPSDLAALVPPPASAFRREAAT